MRRCQLKDWIVEYSLDSDLTLTVWPEDSGQLDPSRHNDQFDLIQVSLIDTWAATAAGAFVLIGLLPTTLQWVGGGIVIAGCVLVVLDRRGGRDAN